MCYHVELHYRLGPKAIMHIKPDLRDWLTKHGADPMTQPEFALPRGPFLDFRANKPWSGVANGNQDGLAPGSEESSIPERIPIVAR